MIEILAMLALGSTAEVKVVTFPAHEITLPGTLTIPDGAAKAVVLMMPGSGPSDRDGNQPPALMTNVLKDTSERLVGEGYATFRFDKRPVHTNKSLWPTDPAQFDKFFSMENHLADVVAAAKFVRGYEGLAGKKLVVMGHSEGGMFALATAASIQPDALVLMGTPGRMMGDVLINQIDNSVDRSALSQEKKDALKSENRRIVNEIKAEAKMPENIPAELKALYAPSSMTILHGYFNFNPVSAAKAFGGDVLVMNGELDVQVDKTKDAAVLFDALKSRSKGDSVLSVIPSASHNLKFIKSLSEPGFSGPIVRQALDDLVKFLNGHL